MSKKQYIGIIILAVIILGFMFYWHSLRPSIIKKGCYNTAKEQAIKKAGIGDKKLFKDDFEFYYKNCLRKKGL